MNSAAGAEGYLLNMTGFGKETVRVMAVAVVVNALLDLVLTSVWGIGGGLGHSRRDKHLERPALAACAPGAGHQQPGVPAMHPT